MRGVSRALAIAILLVAAAAIGLLGYRYRAERYTIATDDDGNAVARVVATSFHGASALKVASLSGIVQVPSADSRWWGWLNSDRVMKAPFTADYFVDVSRLRRRDVAWDARTAMLTVDVPPVTVAPPNVDESRATAIRTRGVFVTRAAGEALQRRASARAQQVAAAEANKPQWLALARERARRSVGTLLSAPLAAAGLHPAEVRVRFPDERGPAPAAGERMDRSRSLDEVFGLDP